MVVVFLQQQDPTPSTSSLGKLLIQFLIFYSTCTFPYITLNPLLPSSGREQLVVCPSEYNDVPVILDPLVKTNNVIKSTYAIEQIQELFFVVARAVWPDCTCCCHSAHPSMASTSSAPASASVSASASASLVSRKPFFNHQHSLLLEAFAAARSFAKLRNLCQDLQ